jgi:hypothetical protein
VILDTAEQIKCLVREYFDAQQSFVKWRRNKRNWRKEHSYLMDGQYPDQSKYRDSLDRVLRAKRNITLLVGLD